MKIRIEVSRAKRYRAWIWSIPLTAAVWWLCANLTWMFWIYWPLGMWAIGLWIADRRLELEREEMKDICRR